MNANTWVSLADILHADFKKEEMFNRPRLLSTGFPTLDCQTGGGIWPGLMLLGASPGLGKSTFALQLAMNVANGAPAVPVLFYSMEMSRKWLTAKILSLSLFEAACRPNTRAAADSHHRLPAIPAPGQPVTPGQRAPDRGQQPE